MSRSETSLCERAGERLFGPGNVVSGSRSLCKEKGDTLAFSVVALPNESVPQS